MNVACHVSEQTAVDAPARRLSMPARAARLIFLPSSLILWAVGVSRADSAHLGLYGLPPALPLVFYAGLAVLLVSAGMEFGRARPSAARLALHAIALVVMLYGTAPLVYKDGRYSWLYKTVGVVQYVSAHGSLDRSIDIYQSWPGFFAFAAWFDKVAGVGSPLDYAKWAQLVLELAAIPLLCTIYAALSLPVWHRWLAVMLYAGSNWIAQDYFSPQGVATVLSLGIMAVVARWMIVAGGRHRRDSEAPGDEPAAGPHHASAGRRLRESAPFIAMLIFLFCVLTATHELSPYIVTVQIAALAIAGLARPRWVALAAAVIALAYLAPNFSYVNSHYGLLSSLGRFFSNFQSPSAGDGRPPESHTVIAGSADLLTAGVWLLALAGAWLRRRAARRTPLALLLLAFSPILVLFGGGYGNEGILRVYLFSLPWAAALAAFALAPPGGVRRAPLRPALAAAVPLALAVALFFPAFFGNDASNVMQPGEVNTVMAFLRTARPGPVFAAIDNAPASDTANYNEWPTGSIFDSPGFITPAEENPGIAAFLARTMVHHFGDGPAYVLVTPSMTAYNAAFGITRPGSIPMLLSSLARSPYWQLVVSRDGTVIYKLTAAARHVPPGPAARNVIAGVP